MHSVLESMGGTTSVTDGGQMDGRTENLVFNIGFLISEFELRAQEYVGSKFSLSRHVKLQMAASRSLTLFPYNELINSPL